LVRRAIGFFFEIGKESQEEGQANSDDQGDESRFSRNQSDEQKKPWTGTMYFSSDSQARVTLAAIAKRVINKPVKGSFTH
jgi:hypothetical protein